MDKIERAKILIHVPLVGVSDYFIMVELGSIVILMRGVVVDCRNKIRFIRDVKCRNEGVESAVDKPSMKIFASFLLSLASTGCCSSAAETLAQIFEPVFGNGTCIPSYGCIESDAVDEYDATIVFGLRRSPLVHLPDF